MVYPGTTIMVQAFDSDCGTVSTDNREDIDVFEEAGDDYIIIFDLEAPTPGDHLIEIFSDCASDYLLAIDTIAPEI